MSFYKRRRPKPEEEKCADPAKARARALDAHSCMNGCAMALPSRLQRLLWLRWWSWIT